MTTTNNTEKTVGATYAIPMDPEHYELVRAAAKVRGLNAASFGRGLVLAEAAKIMGVEVPVIVQGKRGPKGGTKHPLAVKFNLTTAEFNRRVQFHVKNGEMNLKRIDFSIDPFAKVEEVAESDITEESAGLVVEAV